MNNLTRYQPSIMQSHLDHLIFEDWATVATIRIVKVLSGRTKELYNTRAIAKIIGVSQGCVSKSIKKLTDNGYLISINGIIKLADSTGINTRQQLSTENEYSIGNNDSSGNQADSSENQSDSLRNQNEENTIYTNINKQYKENKYIYAPPSDDFVFYKSSYFKDFHGENLDLKLVTANPEDKPENGRIQVSEYVYLKPEKVSEYIKTLNPDLLIKCVIKLNNWIQGFEPMPGEKESKEFKAAKRKGWNASNTFSSWVIQAVRKELGYKTEESFADKLDKADYSSGKTFLD